MPKEFVPINQEPLQPTPKSPRVAITNDDNDNNVQKALDSQKIAEAKLKTKQAEEGIEKIEQLKGRELKLQQDRSEFEKLKSAWIEAWEKQKSDEIEKTNTVKAYWEAKAVPIKEIENGLRARTNRLDTREQTIKLREQSLETRITNLDSTITLKESQIQELKNIINGKAPKYYKIFKRMLSEGERRANWNYNTARGDQWHAFTDRIRIIFESLHRMLFGD